MVEEIVDDPAILYPGGDRPLSYNFEGRVVEIGREELLDPTDDLG